jgi:hypothetical protein
MTDEEFVEASKGYFKRRQIDLHIGCCLLAKIDPESKDPPVGTGYKNWDDEPEPTPFDYTRRPFDVAVRAIRGEYPNNQLATSETVQFPIDDAKSVVLSTRTFVAWATKQWPDGTKSLVLAEKAYQLDKANSPAGYLSSKGKGKTKVERNWEEIKKISDALRKELGRKVLRMSLNEYSLILEKRVRGKPCQRSAQTIRKNPERIDW